VWRTNHIVLRYAHNKWHAVTELSPTRISTTVGRVRASVCACVRRLTSMLTIIARNVTGDTRIVMQKRPFSSAIFALGEAFLVAFLGERRNRWYSERLLLRDISYRPVLCTQINFFITIRPGDRSPYNARELCAQKCFATHFASTVPKPYWGPSTPTTMQWLK
jgi:hypothetical protein